METRFGLIEGFVLPAQLEARRSPSPAPAHSEWDEAQVDTIHLKLLKIGAIVRISVRRVLLQLRSAYPWKHIYAQAFHALRC
jgi:hypothetical protein